MVLKYRVKTTRARVKAYGFDGRVALVAPCAPSLTEYELEKGFTGDKALMERLHVQIREMAALGADLVIPAEGVLNAVLVHNGVNNVDGVPVFDSYGAVMANAEMLVKLQRSTGLRNARSGAYAKPLPEFITHFRRVAIRTLQEADARESR